MKNKNRYQITIIEDDKELLDLLNIYFRQNGFQTTAFENPEEALISIENQKTTPHLIVTDFRLPNLSGVEFTQKIKFKYPNLPVILITGESELSVAIKAVESGADDFIIKPLNFTQLLITAQKAIYKSEGKSLHYDDKKTEFRLDNTEVIAESEPFKQTLHLAKQVSSCNANILINGESGSGKEIVAKIIHQYGNRKSKPFIAINCSAIPENLLESELFGHARGAFTGALDKRVGLFEEANDGILFLDEIGDLPLSLQAKLLRVIQEKKIKRLGENQFRSISTRIICATHKNLDLEVEKGNFREDLYFRLNVIPIKVPPLRDRREDIIPLSEFFLKNFSLRNNLPVKKIHPEVFSFLLNQKWRGNVRELENLIERTVILSSSHEINLEDFQKKKNFVEEPVVLNSCAQTTKMSKFELETCKLSLEEVCKKYIQIVFERNKGAKEQTARDLGIDRKTLYRKLKDIQTQ